MGLGELFLVGIGLSMDAFAVSIGKGLTLRKMSYQKACVTGLWFGIFQALMPLIGFLLGMNFASYIESVDHWIAFVLLGLIGGKMAWESRNPDEEVVDSSFAFLRMLPLAVATSIDALAVGITFAFLNVSIVPAVILIGCTTFVISFAGVKIGNLFGSRFSSKAELLGGLVLIGIGLKILVEHLGFFG